jgi:hypothetical protein
LSPVEALTGCSSAVYGILGGGPSLNLIEVSNHHLTDATDSVKGHTSANAAVAADLASATLRHRLIAIAWANLAHRCPTASLALTLPQLIGASIAPWEAGQSVNGHFVSFCLVVS